MAYREVRVYEVKEVLRLWLCGEGLRSIERMVGLERKTVRRYVVAAEDCGLDRGGGDGQLDDTFMAKVCERARPVRPDGHGRSWAELQAHHDQLKAWLIEDKLTAVKTAELLARQGIVVPERTV